MGKKVRIQLAPGDRDRLEALIANGNTPQKHVRRAQIVLLAGDGMGTTVIQRRLRVSRPTVRRWRTRYVEAGVDGLCHDKTRPPGKPPLGAAVVSRVIAKTKTETPPDATHWSLRTMAKAVGIAPSSVHAIWKAHGLKPHLVATFKLSNDPRFAEKLEDVVGLYLKAPRRGVHRRRRERKPCVGMMVHQDGSRHEWLAGVPPLDLIVTMDDATSEIYSAFLVEEEGTASTFRALKQVFTDKGLPGSLYTDRGSHYFHTPEAGGKVDKSNPTQVGRALHQLGIEHIAAYSPQARGRSERAFGTLQNRLVKELSLAGITEIEAANRFIADTYLPDHNRRFATKPELEASAFASPPPPDQVHEVLCLHTKRVVAHDNTVRHERRVLQIPASPVRHHYVKATVRVHEYPDGTLALFHGPRCLARYQADGEPIDISNRQAA